MKDNGDLKKKGKKKDKKEKKEKPQKNGEYEITLFFGKVVSFEIQDNIVNLINKFSYKDSDFILSSFFRDFIDKDIIIDTPYNFLKLKFLFLNENNQMLKPKKIGLFIKYLMNENVIINHKACFHYYDIVR